MKILYVSSVGAPYRCGIGDYTARLASFMAEKKGFEVKVLAKTGAEAEQVINAGEWCLLNLFGTVGKISDFGPDLVHMQYPGKGLHYFLVLPFLALLLKLRGFRLALTLHEYEISSFPRRLSSFWLAALSRYLLFTNTREREKVERTLARWGFGGKKSAVIGLAPNVFSAEGGPRKSPDKIRKIATFGLFYPGRKMEDVIRIFSKLEGEELEFYLIGAYDERQKPYFEKIKEEALAACGNKKLEFVINKDEKYLGTLFREIDLFVLLYGDGASFKRTSLISAMSFGIPVVSNSGPSTPPDLKDGENILLGWDAEEIAAKIGKLRNSGELYSRISGNSFRLGSGFSWSGISEKHAEFYASVVR